MRVLWITNILFPEASQLLRGEGEQKASGGWMLGAAEALLKNRVIELFMATVSPLVSDLRILKGKIITYYVLPYGRGNLLYNADYEKYWKQVSDDVQPDIIHIHGTEYTHGLAYVNACGSDKVVVSLQGIKSVIAKYYCAGISKKEIYENFTFRDLIRGTIISDQKKFQKSGIYEIELLRKVSHIIGRTSWDKAQAWAVNSKARYYVCNETLRKEFYGGNKWTCTTCRKHSIFLSQAGYPVKGLHQVLKAMPLILRHYPDTAIYIAGRNVINANSIKEKLRLSGYGHYLKQLISSYHLEEKIHFLGNLTAEQMKQEYLKSNVFICPSSIENSPNSLGEAQLLGVPCISSYVGGTPDMMNGNEENLYRFEEVEMLAEKICTIFSNKNNQIDMREEASRRHDPKTNSDRLYEIYKLIIED